MELNIFGACVQLSPLISSTGLFFDIIGAVIIFRFGLPQNIDRQGATYLVTNTIDQEEKDKAKFYDRMSFFGDVLASIWFYLTEVSKLVVKSTNKAERL